jgi:hypothetical protein
MMSIDEFWFIPPYCRGNSFLCYANCPDTLPHQCGEFLCARDKGACDEFVAKTVTSTLAFAATVVASIGTGFVGAAGALAAAGLVITSFKDTHSCSSRNTPWAQIHVPSGLTVMHLYDRDIAGLDSNHYQDGSYDDCLVACAHASSCQYVAWDPKGHCFLRTNIGQGAYGNVYRPGMRVAVSLKRTPEDNTLFNW